MGRPFSLRSACALLDTPARDQTVDLQHEAHGLFEGHHDLAVVGEVVPCERTPRVVRPDGPMQTGDSVPESVAGLLQYQ
jgi:hypothetical protein